MKIKLTVAVVGFALFMMTAVSFGQAPAAKNAEMFNVYTDKNATDNHYVASGWMGDVGDIKVNDEFTQDCHGGSTCTEIAYNPVQAEGKKGWIGVYWQNPPNNWGSKEGGYNLSEMTKLVFWAKGAKGGEIIGKVKVGGIKGTYPDSTDVSIGPIELSDTWEEYSVNLAGKDLSYISGGFAVITSSDLNPNGAKFYLDDMKFVKDESVKEEVKQSEKMPFYVYEDRVSIKNHFIPAGWMGDYGDIAVDTGWAEDAYSGETCVKNIYSGKVSNGARWAGVYWQNPPNNWGTVDGGYDLSSATKLTFWAKGEKGGERIEEFKIGGLMGEFSDSDSAAIGPVILTKDWKQYVIDLKGKDLSYILGGFSWTTNVDVNPEGAVFYLDEIKYE